MTTALRYHTQEEALEELLPTAAGRFGREVQKIACPDPEMAPSRKSEVERMRDLMKKSGYDIDPRLVARRSSSVSPPAASSPSERKTA